MSNTNINGTSITSTINLDKSGKAQGQGMGGAKFAQTMENTSGDLSASSFGFGAQTMVTATASQRIASTQSSSGTAFGAGAAALPGSDGGMSGGISMSGGAGAAGMGGGSNPIGAAAGGGSQQQLLDATKQMQETQMSFNLQYLQLQSQMQHENRSYTAISNIMKTKHDTVKNSISNVR